MDYLKQKLKLPYISYWKIFDMLTQESSKEFTCPRAFKIWFSPFTAKISVKQGLISNLVTMTSGGIKTDISTLQKYQCMSKFIWIHDKTELCLSTLSRVLSRSLRFAHLIGHFCLYFLRNVETREHGSSLWK